MTGITYQLKTMEICAVLFRICELKHSFVLLQNFWEFNYQGKMKNSKGRLNFITKER